jgi:hypothetical protein
MALTIISKDHERTWVVCNKCGEGRDIRKSGECKCGNVKTRVDKDGVAWTEGEDSDEVFYDNTK